MLIRWLILTASILLTAYLVDGVQVSGFFSALFAAALLGILNTFVRPVFLILSLPITILTLGLFIVVINAVLLLMVAGVAPGLTISGFWSAMVGSLIISLVSFVLNSFVVKRGRVQVIYWHRPGDYRDRW
ncbi:MAG: phage holin family protein [Deltaproteobacteria bacterium]|nr:phage holin family protein [Deltaproteobacteria bacterium]